MPSVTIKDVAKIAGVSKKTVSRVLNDEPFVKDSTRQMVVKVIDQLGYRPSQIARGLSMNRTETIGILVSNIANNFLGEVIRGIEDCTLSKNYSLIVCNTDEKLEQESHYLDLLLRHRVDGIIAAATSIQWETLSLAEQRQTPVVFLDRKFEGLLGPFVGVDNEGGSYLAIRHLIDCGHTKIGMIAGYTRLSSIRERQEGYQRALQEQQLPAKSEWMIESRLTVEEGRTAAHKLLSLDDRPTALFVATNLLALGTLIAIQEMGLRCPQDVAIIAFDDHPWAVVCSPPLTVIRQPARKIGQTAAEMLLDLINGKSLAHTNVLLPSELIVRGSC